MGNTNLPNPKISYQNQTRLGTQRTLNSDTEEAGDHNVFDGL